MKLEHCALYVNELEGSKDFFSRCFKASAGEKYHNQKTGFQSYFLSFDDGSRLEIMTRPDLETNDSTQNRSGFAHIAFSTGSKDAVLALTQQLQNDGFPMVSTPGTTGDGYFKSCVLDGEGNRIEITV